MRLAGSSPRGVHLQSKTKSAIAGNDFFVIFNNIKVLLYACAWEGAVRKIRLRSALVFAAAGEIATGAALLVVPSLAGQLLLGEALTGMAIPAARVAGIALIALGIACWPGTPRAGMLTYSTAVTLYLAYLGLVAGLGGILLWPAVILHAILTVALARGRGS
jgi:hypothetical protein